MVAMATTALKSMDRKLHGAMPLQRQIRIAILDKILSGEWQADSRVPSENELVDFFGVSRMTVHHALRALQNEGYLVRVQGMGTFVAPARSHQTLFSVRNVADEIRSRGSDYRLEVLKRGKRLATSAEAALFRLSSSRAQLFEVTILHYENGEPLQLEHRVVNPLAAPDFLDQDFTGATPFEYLMTRFPYPEGKHVVRAAAGDADDIRLLHLSPGEPCLIVERTTWIDDLVITHVTLKYPAYRYEISGTMSRKQMIDSRPTETA